MRGPRLREFCFPSGLQMARNLFCELDNSRNQPFGERASEGAFILVEQRRGRRKSDSREGCGWVTRRLLLHIWIGRPLKFCQCATSKLCNFPREMKMPSKRRFREHIRSSAERKKIAKYEVEYI